MTNHVAYWVCAFYRICRLIGFAPYPAIVPNCGLVSHLIRFVALLGITLKGFVAVLYCYCLKKVSYNTVVIGIFALNHYTLVIQKFPPSHIIHYRAGHATTL